MKKFALVLFSVSLLAGCNKPATTSNSSDSSFNPYPDANFVDKEIPADDYIYHLWTNIGKKWTFLSSEKNFIIAEFKSHEPIVVDENPTKNDDGFYHIYFSFSNNNEMKFDIPEKGIGNYGRDNQFELSLVKVIGTYTSYRKYYYSEKANAVKEELSIFKPVDASKEDDDKLQGKKTAAAFLNNKGEFILMNTVISSINIETVERNSKTQYLQVDEGVEVTFTHDR